MYQVLTMILNLKPVSGYEDTIKELYDGHAAFFNGDSGLDLFCVETITVPARATSVKIPLGVQAQAFIGNNASSFYLYPRSSTGSKTPIRLSNSVGIIDAGYRGPLMAIVDNVSDESFTLQRGERYFQICAPNLEPIKLQLVSQLGESDRGAGGLGSTGKGGSQTTQR